jgi:hypothetical protein
MSHDFDLPLKSSPFVVVNRTTIHKALRLVAGCEFCTEAATIAFDVLLERVTGRKLSMREEYILEDLAECPACGAEIDEKTLVAFDPRARLN